MHQAAFVLWGGNGPHPVSSFQFTQSLCMSTSTLTKPSVDGETTAGKSDSTCGRPVVQTNLRLSLEPGASLPEYIPW
jgi:hypothetical protein